MSLTYFGGEMSEEQAATSIAELLRQLSDARHTVEAGQRRVAGIRKVIDGIVEIFPALEDLLPEDLDETETPHPRGSDAVWRVMSAPGASTRWLTVNAVVNLLAERDWMPRSSNPANAVRTALERLHESGAIEKTRSTESQVIYRWTPPVTDSGGNNYDNYGEEPF